MSLRNVEKGKGIFGCELREVICELRRAKRQVEIWQSSKNNKILDGLVCVLWADVLMLL